MACFRPPPNPASGTSAFVPPATRDRRQRRRHRDNNSADGTSWAWRVDLVHRPLRELHGRRVVLEHQGRLLRRNEIDSAACSSPSTEAHPTYRAPRSRSRHRLRRGHQLLPQSRRSAAAKPASRRGSNPSQPGEFEFGSTSSPSPVHGHFGMYGGLLRESAKICRMDTADEDGTRRAMPGWVEFLQLLHTLFERALTSTGRAKPGNHPSNT